MTIPDGARDFEWSGELSVGAADSWVAIAVDGSEFVRQDPAR